MPRLCASTENLGSQATVPTTAHSFLLHDLFTAPIPQSHKQQGGLHFQLLMVQSLSVTDPFPPLTHSQHVSNTVNSIQTASGCPSPLSHPYFPQSCSSHLKHAFASLSCPSSYSPTHTAARAFHQVEQPVSMYLKFPSAFQFAQEGGQTPSLHSTGPDPCLCLSSCPSFPFHFPACVFSRRTDHFCSVQYEAPLHTGPVHLLFPLMLCISRIKLGHSKYVGVLER